MYDGDAQQQHHHHQLVNRQCKRGWTALHLATLYGHVDCMRALLGTEGVDTQLTTNDGQTLHDVVYRGNVSRVKAIMGLLADEGDGGKAADVTTEVNDAATATATATAATATARQAKLRTNAMEQTSSSSASASPASPAPSTWISAWDIYPRAPGILTEDRRGIVLTDRVWETIVKLGVNKMQGI